MHASYNLFLMSLRKESLQLKGHAHKNSLSAPTRPSDLDSISPPGQLAFSRQDFVHW